MLLSAMSVLVVAQSSSEIPEGLMNNPVHTVEQLVSEPSAVETEMAIEKLKRHESSGIDQIPAELLKAGGRTIEIRQLINSI